MTPDFAKAVDPIIEAMVDLKERIHRRNVASPEAVRDSFLDLFHEADSLLRNRVNEWELAKYALAVWIDEDLSADGSWTGCQYWNEHKLQVQLFPHRPGEQFDGREEFFRRARDARKDALEVFFLCVVLGFQGVYDGAAGMQAPADLRIGLPETREKWLRSVRESIQLSRAPFDPGRPDNAAHPADILSGRIACFGKAIAFVVTSSVAGFLYWIWKTTGS